MKKFLALSLALILAAGLLTGCTSAKSELDTIRERGKLIMATSADFPPYEFREGGGFAGIDVEIAQAIADKIGVTLEVTDMEFDSVVASAQTGKADMAASGLTVREDRAKIVDFSDNYIQATQVIIVKSDSAIASAADLSGKKIGVQIATTGAIYARDEVPDAEVSDYTRGADAVLDLLSGRIDAVVIDDQPAKKFVSLNEGIKILDQPLTDEFYAIAVKKGSAELLKVINETIADMKADGRYQAILDKYLA